jgi:hypothetical protein
MVDARRQVGKHARKLLCTPVTHASSHSWWYWPHCRWMILRVPIILWFFFNNVSQQMDMILVECGNSYILTMYGSKFWQEWKILDDEYAGLTGELSSWRWKEHLRFTSDYRKAHAFIGKHTPSLNQRNTRDYYWTGVNDACGYMRAGKTTALGDKIFGFSGETFWNIDFILPSRTFVPLKTGGCGLSTFVRGGGELTMGENCFYRDTHTQ